MKDKRLQELAQNILNNAILLKQGENLLIEVLGEEGIPLAKELIKEAEKIQAKPFFTIMSYELLSIWLQGASKEQLEEYAKQELVKMKQMDAYVGIRANNNIAELSAIDSQKMEQYNQIYMLPVHFEQRVKHTKWCVLRYPNFAMAQMCKMNIEECEDFYFNVCNLDYGNMKQAMEPLVSLMNRTDKVHIIREGTDLSFSIKGISAQKYFGTYNLPDGEVATAPIKNSVNGYITYNTTTTYNGQEFSNIYFKFQDGKIVEATSNHTKELNNILDTDEGARYIGEFAMGLNPYIKKPIGDTLFDQKIGGSFHFTPGNSLEESDNGNRSSIHWDIVMLEKPEYGGGEIWFDDVLIKKDGKFILEELQALNPENLIK